MTEMPMETYEDNDENYDVNTAPGEEEQDDESGDSGFTDDDD